MRLPVRSGLVAGGLVAALALTQAAYADPATSTSHPSAPHGPVRSTITTRLAPGGVTVYANGAQEPAGIVAQISPAAAGRSVSFQQSTDGGHTWQTLATTRTNAAGRAFRGLQVTTPGTETFRTVVGATAKTAHRPAYTAATSPAAHLAVNDNEHCAPTTPLVDPRADGEAQCLALRLDRWAKARVTGIGQEVNTSNAHWSAPLDALGAHQPAVIGFDLEELDKSAHYYEPDGFAGQTVSSLIDRAHTGAVLVASWHADNPFEPGHPYSDVRHGDYSWLLHRGASGSRAAAVYDRFWSDADAKLALLRRFSLDDTDGDQLPDGTHDPCWCTPVVFRPFHEDNQRKGHYFFWWGAMSPTTYRRLYAELQARAATDDVHNLLWAYSANRQTSATNDPRPYVPAKVDIGGLDSYDPEWGRANAADHLGLEGYSRVSGAPQVHRMALTEVGPQGSNGAWDPAVITRTIRSARISPLWAMLWVDDGRPSKQDQIVGRKQISSLHGGTAWLAGCYDALCYPH